ncbi:MAG: zinc-binding dehydrogenase [Galactobacter sp.]
MKAWRFNGTHKPFEEQDIPEPEAGPGQVKIDVKAAGLCHSDVGILEDEKWMGLFPHLPVTPGHEAAGIIEAVGEGVTDWKVGDRVAVWPLAQGPEHTTGYAQDGGWQPKMVVDTDFLVNVPEGVPWEYAAAATDAGMTSHGAVMGTGQVKAGEKVGIIGIGGLGQIGARVAVLNGAELYVAEVNEAAWPRAEKAGAKRVAKSILDFKDENLDVIIDFAGFGTTTAEAIEAVGFGGRVVQVGMGRLESTINTYALITGRKTLIGSNGGTGEDIQGVLNWMGKGEIEPECELTTWDKIPEGIDRLHNGEVKGRLVALYK